jgi:serine/threonine-protein kinase
VADLTSIDLGALDRASDAIVARKRLPSRHDPLERIGEGGMGIIHVAFDPLLRRHVALKTLSARHSESRTSRKRFATEALVTAQLDHPNIVPIYGLESDPDGLPAYAMKLVDGQTMAELLDASAAARTSGGPVPEALRLSTLLEHFLKVCDAVAFAHEKEVLHRDLKPDNIMLGRHGQVYVMDWGLARTQQHIDLAESAARTGTGQILGTPRYMAPEQALGDVRRIGPAVDQYALGLLLFHIVTCRDARPTKGAFWMNVKAATEGEVGAITPPSDRELPWPALYDTIRRATAVQVEDRYASVVDFAAAVRAARDAPPRPEVPEASALRRWIRRNLDATIYLLVTLMALLAVGTAAAVTVGVLGLEIHASREQAREQATAALLSRVGARAANLDRSFRLVESELQAVASTASALITHGSPSDRRIYDPAEYASPHTRPPDARRSDLYDRVLSTAHPDVSLIPGAHRGDVEAELRRLIPVADRMRAAHIGARMQLQGIDAAAAEAAWRTEPGIFRWVMVATESGFAINTPGGYFDASDFDHRVRPWYTIGVGQRSPKWGRPWQELSTGRLMMACSMAIHRDDEPVGVASMAVGFDHLTTDAMLLDDPAVLETFLLDRDGRVLLRSSEAGVRGRIGKLSDTWATPVYAHADALRDRLAVEGVVRVDDGETLVVHQPLSTGWAYVVELDAVKAGF